MAAAKKDKTVHVSTEAMRTAIAHRWKAPEYAVMWEVGDATGARHSRLADAIIMGLYPSRGIDLQGVEIKTYRSDWLRELKNPAKADQIARYCDFWWVHASPGVVKDGELPTGWGLRVYDGRIWKTQVEATRRQPDPVSREFLAALLRRADQQVEKEAKRLADASLASEREAIDRRVAAGIEERTRRSAALATVADEFEKATGLSLEELSRCEAAAYAARMTAALMKYDLHNPFGGLEWLVKQLRQTAEDTADAMRMIGLTPPTQEESLKYRPKRG